MRVCGSCGATNPDGFRFCGSCGTALGGSGCPACGFVNPEAARFCGQCGSSLVAGAPAGGAPAGVSEERKLATVLFADVVGFTTLAETTDPETVARTVDAAFRRMAEVVTEHGGTVDKYMGDSLMAVFGVPQAHDDDAERAVAAGLAMRGLGGDLAFSIGVNTGEVMVTAVGGEAGTVIGDTVNVAARLEKAAGPGQVLVGSLTAELAGDRITFRERQPVVLKGKRDPVPVWEALGLQSPADGAVPSRVLPLIGRDDELAFLRGQWRRTARDRRASTVLLVGEAGVGKTRLVDELAAEVAEEATVVRAAYPAYGRLGGPRVAAEVVERLGPSGDAEIDVRVRSIAGDLDASLHELDPASLKQEQLWAMRRLLELKAAALPLLLVVDDIHRSGDHTLTLLSELMTRVVEVPAMLVLAGRPDSVDWMARFPLASTLRLAPLGREDALVLAEAMCPALPPGGHLLVDRSGGNPLYLRELLRSQRGAVGLALPPSLRAVVAARLDALPAGEKAALQHVAVIGEAATPDQIGAFGLEDAGAPLGSLLAAGLLRQDANGCYDITDPLLREVAYEAIPLQARGDRHRRAAGVIADPVERARHLDRATGYHPDDADLAAEAAGALAEAGGALLDAHRDADAVDLLLRSVELGLRDPALLVRLAETLVNDARPESASILATLDELDLSPAHEAAREHMRAVAAMFSEPARALGLFDESARRWAEVGNVDKEGWAWSNKGVALFNLGRLPESAVALQRAIEIFARAGNRQGKLAAASFLALVRPEDPRAGDWLEAALTSAREVGSRSGIANALTLLAWHHAIRGYLGGPSDNQRVQAAGEENVALARELGFLEFQAHGLGLMSVTARLAGRIDDAAELAAQARQLGLVEGSGVALLTRGASFLAELAQADPPDTPLPPFVESPDPVAWIAWRMMLLGLVLAARAEEAWPWLTRPEQPVMGADIDGVMLGIPRGLSLVAFGRFEEARDLLERARASAEVTRSGPAVVAATALLTELDLRAGGDPVRPELWARMDGLGGETSGGVAHALVLRTRSLLGDRAAAAELDQAVADLRAPGLLLGL